MGAYTKSMVGQNPNSCWICLEGDGIEDEMEFDQRFDTFYHRSCLDAVPANSILEYEEMRKKDPKSRLWE